MADTENGLLASSMANNQIIIYGSTTVGHRPEHRTSSSSNSEAILNQSDIHVPAFRMSQYYRDLYRMAQHPSDKQPEPINYFSSFRMSFYNSFETAQNSSARLLTTSDIELQDVRKLEGDSDRTEDETQGCCCCC